VNRLKSAAFLQNTSGSSWDKNQVDYSVSGLNYDANGNILSMTQHGFTIGNSGAIDSLTYSYMSNSNKLMGVTDAANNPTSQLGDFHYNPSTKQSTDYSYDGNGNLIQDNNKSIDKIIYNYLNLPQLVHLKGKGNVSYVYDADGIKLAKITVDSMAQHSVRTLYMEGIVYQQTGTMGNPGGATDTLQFISHEEGRARWAYHKYLTVSPGYRFEYDFFEQDHLGNTRVALTQEQDTTNYIATMEAAYRTTESQLFGNIASTSVAFTSIPNYQNIPSGTRYAYTNPNDSVSKVDYNGTTGQTTGPSLLLKVMNGDTIMPSVQCYYASNSITTTNSSFSSVLNSLAAGIVGTSTGAAEGTLSGYAASGSPVYLGLSSFLSTKDQAPPSGYPKAYLNWILLDDQFNYVSSSSGSVATASTTYPANQMNAVAPGGPIVIPRNGYLYVWVSNETQGWDVFFDNFSVQYKQGRVLEENHYYPFGLTMAGISDKAIRTNYAENKFRFNDANELQNKEFSDGSGLEAYDATFRLYDPQLGRFMQQDPIASLDESWAPYVFTHDNPLSFSDPSGLSDTLAPVIVTPSKGIGLAKVGGPAPNVTAPPCPTSVAPPIDPTTIPTPWMNNILIDAAECKGVVEDDDPTFSLGVTALTYVKADDPDPTNTPWCAALGSWELHTSGYPNPRSGGSGVWLDNEKKTLKKTGPYYGAIAIFKDYSDKNLKHPKQSGHITFLYGFEKDGTYVFIGGNQTDKLKFNAYKKTFYISSMKCYMHLEGFYFPSSYHGPKVIAPLVPSDAKLNKFMGIDGSGAVKTN
jgi:RHS repeat-associated protein